MKALNVMYPLLVVPTPQTAFIGHETVALALDVGGLLADASAGGVVPDLLGDLRQVDVGAVSRNYKLSGPL